MDQLDIMGLGGPFLQEGQQGTRAPQVVVAGFSRGGAACEGQGGDATLHVAQTVAGEQTGQMGGQT